MDTVIGRMLRVRKGHLTLTRRVQLIRAVEVMFTLPATTGNVGGMLSRAHAHERLANRGLPLKLFQNIQFLSRQGIALRGHDEQSSIDDSKMFQVMALRIQRYAI